MKIQALLLCISASIVLPACGSGSPDAFIEKSMKYGCQYIEKCDSAMWEAGMFESVNDCRDQILDLDADGDGKTFRDDFAESCTDFDSGAARKCLAAQRKAKGDCDQDLNEVDEPACQEVCGTAQNAGLELGTPLSGDVIARVLEEMEANGELGLDVEDDLTVE